MIQTIYRIQDYNGLHQGVYVTPLTLEEKKEEIVTQLIERGLPKFLLDVFKIKGENSFDLVELEELYMVEEEELKTKLTAYKKEYSKIRFEQTVDCTKLFRPVNRLVFTDVWTKFSRPCLTSNKLNPIIKDLSIQLNIEHDEAIDIIKNISLFAIENMKENEPTRIPYIGSFKIKKNKVIDIKGINYGTVYHRRRIGRRESEQNMD